MRKLIFVLLAFFAVFTYINAFTDDGGGENKQKIPVEIVQ